MIQATTDPNYFGLHIRADFISDSLAEINISNVSAYAGKYIQAKDTGIIYYIDDPSQDGIYSIREAYSSSNYAIFPVVTKPTRVASSVIQAYRLVTTNINNEIIHASSDNINHAGRIIGISENSAATGGVVRILTEDSITNPSWVLSANGKIFLGLDGVLTHDPNTGVFTQDVGYAVNSTTAFISLQFPIILG